MDKPKVTPKDFFLWAGAMIALYWSVFAFIALFFSYIDYAFPDPLQYVYGDPYSNGLSWQMASLLVMFPIYILLSWLINRDTAADPSRLEIWVRRWALMLTLFLAGITMAIDLITLVMYFFNGEITVRFFFKVLLVLMVASIVLMHFLADVWGYWQKNTVLRQRVAWGVSALVVLTIIAGFFIIGTPWQARLYRFDDQKVSDLQQIQSQVVNYWQAKQALPDSLSQLSDSIGGFMAPSDPQTNQPFSYQKTGDLSFKLCAQFNAPTQNYASNQTGPRMPMPAGVGYDQQMNVWSHGAGEQCFARTIDRALYPPAKNTEKPQQI